MAGTGQLPKYLMPYTLNTTILRITATQYHRLITNKRDLPITQICKTMANIDMIATISISILASSLSDYNTTCNFGFTGFNIKI